MGVTGAYLEIERREHAVRPNAHVVGDFEDFVIDLTDGEQRGQASRCMNCGVPFCQSGLAFNGQKRATGCPLHNLIPEVNDLFCQGRLDDAAKRLALTNPFPEFTGRVCPAPCETACNLGLHDNAVTIHDNERALSNYSWEAGMEPLPAALPGAPLVSVVGSGPAGLAAAWELARRGVRVCVYERDERPGGLLMFGIPNMKLSKGIVERRIDLMKQSGITFVCGVDACDCAADIAGKSDAIVLACGARVARSVDVPGAQLDGIHFALDYLSEATRALLDEREPFITAREKDVVVIGGGDTGVDCVATALRQGARSVCQVIRAQRPPDAVDVLHAWPGPRAVYEQGYGQREALQRFGADPRVWGTDTVGYADDGSGRVAGVRVRTQASGEEYEIPAQLVLVAKGFTGAEQRVLDAFASCENVHVAGDARLGPTLVATALADGLRVADAVIEDLGR